MITRIAVPDLVTNSYFPALAAQELGFFRGEGIDGRVELIAPAPQAMSALRNGEVDFVVTGAHSALTAFPGFRGAKLAVAVAQGTPWLLVLRADIPAVRGDVRAVKGLRIGAAPGPDAALVRLLAEAGVDPARDGVQITRVPGTERPGTSFGVLAAEALRRGELDGFWANALGSENVGAQRRRSHRGGRAARRRSRRRPRLHVRRARDHRGSDRQRCRPRRRHGAGDRRGPARPPG